MKGMRRDELRRTLTSGLLLGGIATVLTTPAAAQGMGGWEATPGHLARTLAHLIGIAGGVAILYYVERIRRETRGSTLATSSKYVLVGTALFILVFVGMEANHLLGIDLWYFARGMDLTQTWWMITLAAMMLLYTLGFRTLVKEVSR